MMGASTKEAVSEKSGQMWRLLAQQCCAEGDTGSELRALTPSLMFPVGMGWAGSSWIPLNPAGAELWKLMGANC